MTAFDYGMVSAPNSEAVEAGLEILQAGGNVVDAAVGAALVQTTVDPMACGIAGFGSMHIYLADSDTHKIIDFHGRAPLACTPDMWVDCIVGECDDGFGFILREEVNEIGYQSATTPMTLRALEHALTAFGTMDIAEMMPKAIDYCDNGFLVTPYIHAFWTRPPISGRVARSRGLTESTQNQTRQFLALVNWSATPTWLKLSDASRKTALTTFIWDQSPTK